MWSGPRAPAAKRRVKLSPLETGQNSQSTQEISNPPKTTTRRWYQFSLGSVIGSLKAWMPFRKNEKTPSSNLEDPEDENKTKTDSIYESELPVPALAYSSPRLS